MKNNNSGFTFVELAISMVIIGILIVGVLAGQVLIRSAKIRAVVSETSSMQAMYNLFVEKYQAPPGDIADATSNMSGAGISNGNGDGLIVWTYDGALTASEGAQAFMHLIRAEMFSASLTGTVVAGTSQAIIGTNAAASKFNGAGYYWDNNGTKNIVGIGAQQATGACNATIFSGDDARDLDNKMDDGIPNTGRTRGVGGTCTGAAYPVGTATACSLTVRVN